MITEHITSRHNPVIVEAIKLLSDTKFRKEKAVITGEGTKLLSDAAESGVHITTVIASEQLVGALPHFAAEKLILVPERLFEAISTQKSPQGALMFCRRPEVPGGLQRGRYIVLDGLQDPGNVGTVIRSAAAFGIDGVILCGASADPYGPKAVRASMGAIFRVPVFIYEPAELHNECKRAGIRLLAAMPAGDAEDIRRIDREALAVVIGSEGTGVSDELLAASDGSVTIPMAKGTESLNAAAAAAVILWEIARDSR